MPPAAAPAPATFTYPQEIIQGENYVIIPVTTQLQRELLAGGNGKPDDTLQAYLQINGEPFLQQPGLIDPSALNLQELRLHLRKYSDRRRGALAVHIIVGLPSDRSATDFLMMSMNGLGSSMGFQRSPSSMRFLGGSSEPNAPTAWQRSLEFIPVIEAERVIEGDEGWISSEHFRAAAVRTTLSRALSQGASCVVMWPQVVRTRDDLPVSEPLVAELNTLIGKLNLQDKSRLSLQMLHDGTPAAQEVMEVFARVDRRALEQQLGFQMISARSTAVSR